MVFPFDGLGDYQLVFKAEHEMFRKAVREFVEKEIRPLSQQIDETDEVPKPLLEKMAQQGFFGLHLSEEYGGQGGDTIMTVILSEEIARVSPAVTVVMGTNDLFSIPVLIYGNEEQKKKYLPPLAKGEKFGAFAATEPCCGSDVAGFQTKAEKKGNKWVINGRKMFISNADLADYLIVFARTSPPPDRKRRWMGLTAFIVEKNTPGLSLGMKVHKMGLRGSHTWEVILDNVEVPDENRVGMEGMGFLIAMETFDRTRIGVAAQGLGMAQAAYEAAFTYVHQRKAFELPLASFEAVEFSLVNMLSELMAARYLTYLAAYLADQNRPEFTFAASLAKFYATEAAEKIISDAINLHGGVGITTEVGLEKLARDAKITQIYEGANNIQRLVAYRQLVRILRNKGVLGGESTGEM